MEFLFFLICLFKLPYITLSRVITAAMLFLQFVLYTSSFVGTLKYEILGATLELCQLKIEHFSPGILKFNTKHEDNPFTWNCFTVPCTFLFIFHAGSRGLGSKNFRNSSYKEKRPVRPVFPDYLSVSYDHGNSYSVSMSQPLSPKLNLWREISILVLRI